MDIKAFLKLINRYKWILIIVPIIAAGVTYYFVKNLPKEYLSEAQIATGLVDQSKQVSGAGQSVDYFKTNQQFSNIIEKMRMRKIISILSYNLILHDLQNPTETFKKHSDKIDSLSADDKQKVIDIYKQKLQSKSVNIPADNKGPFKLYDIISSMGYDEASLNKKLEIYRNDNSDFVSIRFTSANPVESAFVVNTLASEFINNFGIDVNYNQNQSISVLDSLLKVKERDMNEKNAALKDFKMKNGVLNLDKQSELVYTQITQAEDRKAQVIRDIQATQGAIAAIDRKLKSADPNMGKDLTVDNTQIINLKNQLEIANKRYIDGNFKPADKKKVDSLTSLQSALTVRNSDKYIVDPQVSRQNLLQQKYNLETTLAQLQASVRSIDQELSAARSKYNSMVPFDAGIQNYVRDADMSTKDYLEALNRVNQTQTEQNIGLKLQIAQLGLPGVAERSKTMIFVALAGIAAFFVCFSGLVVLYFLDNAIYTAQQLSSATRSRVLGKLTNVSEDDTTIRTIWNDKTNNPNYTTHKDLLRSLRFEISSLLATEDDKILGITSLSDGVGKTFVASNLAYAFAMTGKKVLLIGGDKQPVVESDSKQLTTSQNFETFLAKREIQTEDLITRLNKIGDHKSLLEIQNEGNLRASFELLRKQFDVIIIDINSLSDINIAKEWLSFTEKNLAIFEAGKSFVDNDKELIGYLKSQPGFIGWVLNKIQVKNDQ